MFNAAESNKLQNGSWRCSVSNAPACLYRSPGWPQPGQVQQVSLNRLQETICSGWLQHAAPADTRAPESLSQVWSESAHGRICCSLWEQASPLQQESAVKNDKRLLNYVCGAFWSAEAIPQRCVC